MGNKLLTFCIGSFSNFQWHAFAPRIWKFHFSQLENQFYRQQVVQLQLQEGPGCGWLWSFLFLPRVSLLLSAQAPILHHQRLGYSCPGSATPDNPRPCFPARRVTPIVMFYSIVPSRSQKVEKYQAVPNQKVQQLIHNIQILHKHIQQVVLSTFKSIE